MDEVNPQSYQPNIFSTHGRLGRVRYVGYGFIVNLVLSIAIGIFMLLLAFMLKGSINQINPVLIGFVLLMLYTPMLAVTFIMAKRRLNDLNLSGWFSLLQIIPLVNIFFWLYLVFAPGMPGPNRYGPQPSPNSMLIIVLAWVLSLLFFVGGILAAVAIPAYTAYAKKAKFTEVVLATSTAKIGVEICAQNNAEPQAGLWTITGCGAGANGVPQDITTPTGLIASVTTTDNGVITATAITSNGLQGETFILTPIFSQGKTSWTVGGTCKTTAPKIC
jgi:uncharacterized membrane protein YhaH (DUF805 family)/Tfp pilus assembly major pilin PilA